MTNPLEQSLIFNRIKPWNLCMVTAYASMGHLFQDLELGVTEKILSVGNNLKKSSNSTITSRLDARVMGRTQHLLPYPMPHLPIPSLSTVLYMTWSLKMFRLKSGCVTSLLHLAIWILCTDIVATSHLDLWRISWMCFSAC